MINIQEITNKSDWDSFLINSKIPSSFFQSYEWGQFELSQQKKVNYLGFFDSEKKIIGLALAVLVNAKRGRFIHIRNGPLFNWDDLKSKDELLTELIDYAKKQKCDFLRISPLILKSNEGLVDYFKNNRWKYSQMHDVDAEITWILDLNDSEEEILKNMRKQTRYLINRSQKTDDLEVISTTDINLLGEFWKIYQSTVERHKWKAYSFDYIKKEFEIYVQSNMARLFLAKYQGKFIAGAIFIYFNGMVYYHHAGSLYEYKNIPAMYLLHWKSIIYAKDHGFKYYNFFGIAPNDHKKHPWSGLTLFKKGFGGKELSHMHAIDYPITKKYWLTHYFEKFVRIKRGYGNN